MGSHCSWLEQHTSAEDEPHTLVLGQHCPLTHCVPVGQHTLLLQTWLVGQQLLPPKQTCPAGQQLVLHCCTRLQQVRPRKHVSVLLQHPPLHTLPGAQQRPFIRIVSPWHSGVAACSCCCVAI